MIWSYNVEVIKPAINLTGIIILAIYVWPVKNKPQNIALENYQGWIAKYNSKPKLYKNNWNEWKISESIFKKNNIEILFGGKENKKLIFNIKIKKNKYKPWSRSIYYTWQDHINNKLIVEPKSHKIFFGKIINKFFTENTSKKRMKFSFLMNKDSGVQIVQNGATSFNSSWGVANSKTSSFEMHASIQTKDCTDQIINQLKNHQGILFINVSSISFAPNLEILNPPVERAYYKVSNFLIDNNNVTSNMQNNWQEFLIPKNSDNTNLNLILPIAQTLLEGLLVKGTKKKGLSMLLNKNIDSKNENLNQVNYNLQKNMTKINTELKNFAIKISGQNKIQAKSKSLIGDKTETRIKDGVFLINLEADIISYKEK